MKKTKKIVALVVVMVMMLAVVATVFAACDNSNTVIWVSEIDGVATLTQKQIEEFNKTWTGEFKISAKIRGVSEGESATSVLTDVETAPDIYCFAQDQTARLVQAAALSAPGKAAQDKIKAENDASAISASTVGGDIVCYPMTSDNGYFMIYDKRVITDSVDKTSLTAVVKACEDANKKFAFETSTSAWYLASFFFATGCHSSWTTDKKGEFTSVDDDWNSDNGLISMKGIQQLVKSPAHVSSSAGDEFGKGAAVLVSGTWALEAADKAIGKENLGYAELPSFTVDGKTYHLGSYMGNKLMGVKPQTDPAKAQALHALAQYLTSKECQLQRFEEFGWGPSNLEAQNDNEVKANGPLMALNAQNKYAVTQGQIHGSWWDIAKVLGQVAYDATDEKTLIDGLAKYEKDIKALFEMTEAQKRAWSVIGSIGGTSWDTDLEMVETEENSNIWVSKDAFTFDDKTEWVFRKGKDWNFKVAYNDGESKVAIRWDGGTDIQNLSLAKLGQAAGTYKLKLTLTFTDDKATNAVIEFIPA